MIRYKHTQFGWVIVGISLLAGAFLSITAISNKEYEHLKGSFLLGAFILFLIALLFNSLTTVISNDNVRVYFGSGLIHRNISLNQIQNCIVIKKGFILGWGIRFGRGFMIWNVSGYDSVELTLKNRKWKFRIGTDKPEELCDAINIAIKEQPH